MGKYIATRGNFIIFREADGCYIVRNRIDMNRHAHLKAFWICKKLIKMVDQKIIPDSPYLKESAIRLSTDRKYRDAVTRSFCKL